MAGDTNQKPVDLATDISGALEEIERSFEGPDRRRTAVHHVWDKMQDLIAMVNDEPCAGGALAEEERVDALMSAAADSRAGCRCVICDFFAKADCPRVDAEAGVMLLQYRHKRGASTAARVSEGETPGVCRVCGCTEDAACLGPDGEACSWANEEKTLCSACEAKAAIEREGKDFELHEAVATIGAVIEARGAVPLTGWVQAFEAYKKIAAALMPRGAGGK